MLNWIGYIVAGAWLLIVAAFIVATIGMLLGYVRPHDEGPGRYLPLRRHRP